MERQIPVFAYTIDAHEPQTLGVETYTTTSKIVA